MIAEILESSDIQLEPWTMFSNTALLVLPILSLAARGLEG